jgi:hypothetical protein
MNDTELDEMLDSWKSPAVPASLREGVRDGIAAGRRKPLRAIAAGWKLWTAAAAAAIVAIVILAGNNAFPERAGLPPYTVESEIHRYSGSHLEPETATMTSFNQDGSEVVLSWSSPDHPLEAALTEMVQDFSIGIKRIHPLMLTPDQIARRQSMAVVHPTVTQSWTVGDRTVLVNSGCRALGLRDKLLGEEIILSYPTVAVQHDIGGGWMMTLWMAPDLSCFALRAKIEAQQPDGSWTTVSEKKAVKVTLNR